MDKKVKKRIDIANKKLQLLRQQLAGARQQDDEPGEVKRLEAQISTLEEELRKLKES